MLSSSPCLPRGIFPTDNALRAGPVAVVQNKQFVIVIVRVTAYRSGGCGLTFFLFQAPLNTPSQPKAYFYWYPSTPTISHAPPPAISPLSITPKQSGSHVASSRWASRCFHVGLLLGNLPLHSCILPPPAPVLPTLHSTGPMMLPDNPKTRAYSLFRCCFFCRYDTLSTIVPGYTICSIISYAHCPKAKAPQIRF